MNKISELRRRAGLEIDDVADLVGVDVVELALAERGIGLTHFDVIVAMASVLDSDPDDLYPALADSFRTFNEMEDGDIRERMLDPKHSSAFVLSGVDPDIAVWYAIVKLTSGNERRYRVSSGERERIRLDLSSAESVDGYLLFTADCRQVAVRRSAIGEIHFTNAASYAPFSSHENAYNIVLVSPRSPRPETIRVEPDGGPDGNGSRPFFDFLEAARDNAANMKFLLLEEDGDEHFVGIDMMELLEIPIGVLMPDIYEEETCSVIHDAAGDLNDMKIMGQA